MKYYNAIFKILIIIGTPVMGIILFFHYSSSNLIMLIILALISIALILDISKRGWKTLYIDTFNEKQYFPEEPQKIKLNNKHDSKTSIYLEKYPILKGLFFYFPSLIFVFLVIFLVFHFKLTELTLLQFSQNIYLYFKSEPLYSIIYAMLLFYFADIQIRAILKKNKNKS